MKRINITCPACGSRAYLRPASVVYGDKAPDPDAKYYVCGRYPACDCYVAAHRKTMLPMGTLADTMDLDATIKGANVNVEDIENLISSIVTVPIDDGVKFQLKSISEIMDEAEYPGIRVSMSTTFDGVVTPLKIDISTGDAITPREVRYSFKLMLEDRSIDIWAYNLETVLAEKLETIITRTTTNTRMRDFYDIYILEQLHGTTLNPKILHDALLATAHKRGSEKYLNQAEEVFDEVENDSVMQKLWEAYRKKFSYASDLEWDVIMKVIRRLYVLCEKGISL